MGENMTSLDEAEHKLIDILRRQANHGNGSGEGGHGGTHFSNCSVTFNLIFPPGPELSRESANADEISQFEEGDMS